MMNNVNYKYTFIILNYEQSRERENKNKFMTWFCILINQFFFLSLVCCFILLERLIYIMNERPTFQKTLKCAK